MTDSNVILSAKNVFKVFGNDPDTALKMLEEGNTKEEIFDRTGQTVGVMDASFSVKRGEIFVIMGLSGSGKSTMVRLLNRLIEPTSGSIELNGKDITGLGDNDLLTVRRKEMSMVFQSFALMPHMTVLDNAAFGLEVSDIDKAERNRRAQEALEQVGLGGHGASYPHQLSGGMQQRVGLARALTNDPTILLMDEAFSALDPLIRYEMQGELIRLQQEQQRTIIFISHDLDEAIRIGDRIAIMEGGRIVQIGKPDEILMNPADDYVRTFFQGVDPTKILKAKDVAAASRPCKIQLNGSVHLQQHTDADFGYVIDDTNRLRNVVELQGLDCDTADANTITRNCIDDHQVVYGDNLLKDIVKQVADVRYPLPVIDRDGAFLGVITKDNLLNTISG